MRLEGLVKLKTLMTSSGIEPATYGLQHCALFIYDLFNADSITRASCFEWQRYSSDASLLVTLFKLVSCLSYLSTLKIEATYSSETAVDFQRTTWRYIPEDRTVIGIV
jgi:hypothetical protein